jgi:GxxExxY protein
LTVIETIFSKDDPSRQIVDAAFKVHQALGTGLLESIYEECLAFELAKRGFMVERQKAMPVLYDGHKMELGYRLDLVVNNQCIIEIKAVEKMIPLFDAQILTYLKLSGISTGFLINFNVPLFKEGVKRFKL